MITINLSPAGIDKMLAEVKAYREKIERGTQTLLNRLAEAGLEVASVEFEQALYAGENDVQVHVEDRGDHTKAVVAVGKAALFIEFGTGVTYADDHPDKPSGILGRGQYGHRLGRLKNGWRYTGDPGNLGEVISDGKHAGEVHTVGNPANRCMYNTRKELEDRIATIAREVFT